MSPSRKIVFTDFFSNVFANAPTWGNKAYFFSNSCIVIRISHAKIQRNGELKELKELKGVKGR